MNKIISLSLFLALIFSSPSASMPVSVEGVVYLPEYESLQAAVDAVPNGGTVIIPRGIWEGDAVIPEGKYVHIEGVSPAVLGQKPPRYSGQWDYLLENYPDTFLNGSILRGTLNATSRASKLSVSNLLMIGHGDGVAIDIGASGYMNVVAPIENVSIGNYGIAVRAIKAYQLTVDKMQISGVDIGLVVRDGNLNRLTNIDVTNATLGADLKGEVILQGGSFENCGDGVEIYQTAGYVGQIHFEAITGISLYFDGYGGELAPNFYASNSGHVIVNGYNNVVNLGWGNGVTEFTASSKYNYVTLWGNYTDSGYQNLITKVH